MGKNICIVTVYNSINCGSYWQAYVLGEFLKNYGYSVCYLERKGNHGSSNTFGAFLKRCIKMFLKSGIGGASRAFKQYKSFIKYQHKFNLKKEDDLYSNIFCFILGSDTIWNLNSKYFAENRKKYWGFDFKNNRVISYGASVGDTAKEELDKYDELPAYLNVLHAISVRDEYSRGLISNLTNNTVELVCDPTLLWTKDDYKNYIGNKPKYKFIFLYLFKELNEKQFQELKSFALQHNLVIVDGSRGDKRADINAVCEPYNFLNNMYYADYIITDTFHGTVFSIIFEKNFIVVNRGKKKVNEFLNDMGLSSRLLFGTIEENFNENIDYDRIKLNLDDFRKKSINYLISALSE